VGIVNGVAGSPDACLRCGGDVAADRDFCDWCQGIHPELCTCPQCQRDRLLSHPAGAEFDLVPVRSEETRPHWADPHPFSDDISEWHLNAAATHGDGTVRALAKHLINARAEIGRLRAALLELQGWDMLTLTPDGKGCATADAPWARALIAEALGGAA